MWGEGGHEQALHGLTQNTCQHHPSHQYHSHPPPHTTPHHTIACLPCTYRLLHVTQGTTIRLHGYDRRQYSSSSSQQRVTWDRQTSKHNNYIHSSQPPENLGGEGVPQHARIYPYPAHYYAARKIQGCSEINRDESRTDWP